MLTTTPLSPLTRFKNNFTAPYNYRSTVLKILYVVVFSVVYFLACKAGLSLAFFHASATTVWHGTGLALAILLLWGYRLAPGIFLGALAVNLSITPSMASLGIAAGNTLEAILGAWLIQRFSNGKNTFDRINDIWKFIFIVAF